MTDVKMCCKAMMMMMMLMMIRMMRRRRMNLLSGRVGSHTASNSAVAIMSS